MNKAENGNSLFVASGITLESTSLPHSIVFFYASNNNNEIIRICDNGDIFVKGVMIENDKQVVDALREFLSRQGFIK